MDIGGITSAYNDIYASASSQSASKLESKLDTDYSKATDDELLETCKEFEAYFLEQVFKEMMKTIPKNDEEESGANSTMMEYSQELMIQSLASDSTENSGLGLAQMLYEQMKQNYGLNSESI